METRALPTQNMLNLFSIHYIGVPQAPSRELSPTKQILPWWTAPWDQKIKFKKHPPDKSANQNLTDFPSSLYMTQGHFIVEIHAKSRFMQGYLKKCLVHSAFTILERHRSQAIVTL